MSFDSIQSMDTIKKTLGRRKIPIQKIQKKSDLKVAFSKRRSGLFKKASELAVLCGAQIGILVESPGGKCFTYGHPSVESVIRQFQSGQASTTDLGDNNEMQRRKYMEVERKLDREKEEERKIKQNGVNGFWFIDDPLEDDEEEIGDYLEAIETLRGNVLGRIQNMEKPATQMTLAPAPANATPPPVETVGDEMAAAGQHTGAPDQHCSNNRSSNNSCEIMGNELGNEVEDSPMFEIPEDLYLEAIEMPWGDVLGSIQNMEESAMEMTPEPAIATLPSWETAGDEMAGAQYTVPPPEEHCSNNSNNSCEILGNEGNEVDNTPNLEIPGDMYFEDSDNVAPWEWPLENSNSGATEIPGAGDIYMEDIIQFINM